MENKKFDILVNFEGTDSITSEPIILVKGDYNSVDLVFQFDKIAPLYMFFLIKPNKEQPFVTVVSNNRVTIDSASILKDVGKYYFGVSLYDEDSKLTNAKKGIIEVVDNGLEINPDDIKNDDGFAILDDLIKNVESLIPEYNKNAEKKLKEYNDNATNKFNSFNENYETKLNGLNSNILQIEEDAEEKTGVTFSKWGNSKRIEMGIENHFALTPDYDIYTVRFPLWDTSNTCTGEKLDANKDKSIVLATDTTPEINNYSEAWKSYDVNAVADDDGIRHVLSVKGMPEFEDKGKVDVFCLFRTYYQKIWVEDGYLYISRSFVPRDGYTVVPQAVNKDGTINSWFVIGKYAVGLIDDILYSSKGLAPAHYLSNPPSGVKSTDISYNGCINNMKKKGKYYSSGLLEDYMHILTTFYLQFATKNTQSILGGNTNNNYQYVVAQTESNVRRVILTNSQANNIDINTFVSVGDRGTSTNNDRNYGYMHNIAYDVKVIGKEAVGSDKTALLLDCEPITTTDTTIVSTFHEVSGFSDYILGRNGSIGSNTNCKHGMVFNGIELNVGGYEVCGNAFMDIVNASGDREIYYTNDATKLTTSIATAKTNYKKSDLVIRPQKLGAWNYITEYGFDVKNGIAVPTKAGQDGAGSNVGFADGLYVDAGTSGQREFLWLGNMNNGTTAGLSCLNANNTVSNANWNILARISRLKIYKFRHRT